jgi:hypothetical protein
MFEEIEPLVWSLALVSAVIEACGSSAETLPTGVQFKLHALQVRQALTANAHT